MGGPTAWVLGEVLTMPSRKKSILLGNFHTKSLRPGLTPWYDLSNEKDMRLGTCKC